MPATAARIHIAGGFYYFDGVSFESTHGVPADNGDALWISGSGGAWLNNTAFCNAASHHILVAAGGSLSIGGPVGIYGGGDVAHDARRRTAISRMYPTRCRRSTSTTR